MQIGFQKEMGTFRHGVHPKESKDATCRSPIRRMPFAEELILPLSQHLGAPSVPLVKAGMRVVRGEMIAKPGGYVSVALHAPVSGTVTAVELRAHPNGNQMPAIVIRTDPFSSQQVAQATPPEPGSIDPAEFARRVQEAGLVGLGGAAFPSHVKLKLPEDKQVKCLVLNGCECEPYLTCDHRVMVEEPEGVLDGLLLMMKQVGAGRGYVGVEDNKPDAISALRRHASGKPIEIVPLRVKYPQGAEKMLIDSIFQTEVPSGGLPLDLEIVVHNVGTALALSDLFKTGRPLIERAVTITGSGIRNPANLMVPIGTPIGDVIEECGGLVPGTRQLIMGGPMMGVAQSTLDVPVLKGTSGILALTNEAMEPAIEQACIRCGRCLEACPMFLNPSRFATVVRAERPEEAKESNILDCFECASCSYACPSNIPLVHLIRVGKGMVRQMKEPS